MRILIVTQYFWPEHFRVNDLAAQLSAAGHRVTVLTGLPNYPEGKLFRGYEGRWRVSREVHAGIDIIRVPLIPRGSAGGLRLALNYLSFAATASLLGPFCCRGDYDLIIVCQLSPATCGIPGVLLKKLKRAPLLFWVLDLWPESLSATDAVASKWVLDLVGRMMKVLYSHCDRILISSRGFGPKLVERGVPPSRIEYFPNWVERPTSGTSDDGSRGRQLACLPEGFRLVFAGNVGAAQDFPTILAAADALKEVRDLHWIVLGDGRKAEWVKGEVHRRGLGDVIHLLGRQPPESMPHYFAVADAMLVTLKRTQIFSLTVPGKVQSYMAAGRPIVAALDGEGERLIRESGSGLTCSTEDPRALAAAVLSMYHLSEREREQMGARGKAYCGEHFNREKQFTNLMRIVRDVVGPAASS